MPVQTNRRAFFGAVGGAVAWPLAARGQQSSVPTIGFLVSASAAGYGSVMGPILKGLSEAGYVDGKNLKIEYRWADIITIGCLRLLRSLPTDTWP